MLNVNEMITQCKINRQQNVYHNVVSYVFAQQIVSVYTFGQIQR